MLFPSLDFNLSIVCGYTGVLPFDVIVETVRFNRQNLVLAFGISGGVKKSKFAVCLIFWFELHARWLDWCQIGENP